MDKRLITVKLVKVDGGFQADRPWMVSVGIDAVSFASMTELKDRFSKLENAARAALGIAEGFRAEPQTDVKLLYRQNGEVEATEISFNDLIRLAQGKSLKKEKTKKQKVEAKGKAKKKAAPDPKPVTATS